MLDEPAARDAPASSAALFEPFGSRLARGAGLSLAALRRVMQQQGGEVTAVPRQPPARGVLFRLDFARSRLTMETLLIVDDDVSLLESLKMHFEDAEKDGAAPLPGGDRHHRRRRPGDGAGARAGAGHPGHDAPGPERPGHHRGA